MWTDRYLDSTRKGPLWMKQPQIAEIVETSIRFCARDLDYYELEAYVVMANHVHMLIYPRTQPVKLLRTLKGFTARECNKLLGLTGNPFWQKESYDHWVRDEQELKKIAAYIESNPVTAGIAATPEAYRWSSAWHRARS